MEPVPVTGIPQASTLTTRMNVPLIGVAHVETVATTVHPLRGNAEYGERPVVAALEAEQVLAGSDHPDGVLRPVEGARELPDIDLAAEAEHGSGGVDPGGACGGSRSGGGRAGIPDPGDDQVPGQRAQGTVGRLRQDEHPAGERRQGEVRDVDDALAPVAGSQVELQLPQGDVHVLAAGDERAGRRLEPDV